MPRSSARMRRGRVGATSALVLAGLALAACGRTTDDGAGSSGSDGTEDVTIAPVETPSAETPTAQDDSEQESSTGLPTREPEVDLSDFDTGRPVEGSDGVFTADPGQCLEDPEPGPRVSCDEEHGAEVFYTFNLPDGDYPGDDVVSDEATSRCGSQLEAYLGGPAAEGGFTVEALTPSEETWDDDGDTEVLCLIVGGDEEESAFQSLS